jgi:FAD/FMN-containing dehydrogenase
MSHTHPGVQQISRQAATALDTEISGSVMMPGDDDYAVEGGVFNLTQHLEPALVVAAASAADIQSAVRFAAERGLPIAVKSSAHQVIQPSHQAVLITTDRMNEVEIDAVARTARVQAGVRWQQVIDAAYQHGLAPLSGSSPDVGVVGYTIGGGMSPTIGRSHGYAADHVNALEIVTADSTLRQVTADTEPDLFWAVRGGKGNFGVVTAMEFGLFPVPTLYGGGIYFPGERLADVMHTWAGWIAGVPWEMNSSVAVQRLPPLPEVPEPLRGAFVVHLRIAYQGGASEGSRLVAPFRALGPILLDTVGNMPYTAVGSIHADPPAPIPYYDRSMSLRGLPPQAVDAFVEVTGPESGCPLDSVEIRAFGGAFDQNPRVPNAVSTRGIPFALFCFGVSGPDDANHKRGYLAKVVDKMQPWSDPHMPLNFLSPDEATTVSELRTVYGADHYQRLASIKRIYDPANMFRINHNIVPE